MLQEEETNLTTSNTTFITILNSKYESWKITNPNYNSNQTIINTLAWTISQEREASHVKLSEFYKKSEENITALCEKVKKIIIANNWRDNHIYIIVATYLREVTCWLLWGEMN